MSQSFVYPPDRTLCMTLTGPTDKRFEVQGGRLVFAPNRDVRFPYIYEVASHPLLVNRPLVKRIWIFVQDTREDAINRNVQFADSLNVPLGPDDLIKSAGLFEIKDGTVVLARPMVEEPALQNPLNDTFFAWGVDGHRLLDQATIEELMASQEEILGNPDDMTAGKPRVVDGCLVGGTAFERLNNVDGVKGGRCYSLTCTHQRARNLVGPTAGGKVYGDHLGMSELMRQRVVKVYSKVSMMCMKAFLPSEVLEILEENAEINNHPRVGVHENVAFPALQLNLASAVSQAECKRKGLGAEMGHFGAEKGHTDGYDSFGGCTTMGANSRCPPGYEPGRLHLLGYGLYFRLTEMNFMNFTGLVKHGGTPLIAPAGEEPVPWACRHVVVAYCPESMLGPAGSIMTPMASLPDGSLFKLGPEITSYNSLIKQKRTNEANWAQDGEVLMDRHSHFNFYVRLLLQLSSYLLQQLPEGMEARIDPDLFLSSFSMRVGDDGEREAADPWDGAPDGATFDHSSSVDLSMGRESDDLAMDTDNNPGSSTETARFLRRFRRIRKVASERGVNSTVLRREQALCWIDYLEYRSQFLNAKRPDFDALRTSILEGPSAVRERKKRKADDSQEQSGRQPKRSRTKAAPQANVSTAAISKHIERRTNQSSQQSSSHEKESNECSTDENPSSRYNTRSSNRALEASQGSQEVNRGQCEKLVQKLKLIPEVVITRRPPRAAVPGTSVSRETFEEPPSPDNVCSSPIHRSDTNDPHLGEMPQGELEFPSHDAAENDSGEDSDVELGSEPDDSNYSDSEESLGDADTSEHFTITSLLPDTNEKNEVNTPSDEQHIQGILAQFTIDSLVDPLADFSCALENHESRSSDRDLVQASKLCAGILQRMEEKPTSIDTALSIRDLWANISILERHEQGTSVDLRLWRAFIMDSWWRAFRWVVDVISSVLHANRRQTWLERLVYDIKKYYEEICCSHRRQPPLILSSAAYLPRLNPPSDYEVTWARYSYDEGQQARYLFKHVSGCLSTWLGFPSDKGSIARCAIVDALLSDAGYGILVLDLTWKLFSKPYLIINRGKTNRNITDIRIRSNLQRFCRLLKDHPFNNPDTDESKMLTNLTILLHRYTANLSDNTSSAIATSIRVRTQASTRGVRSEDGDVSSSMVSFAEHRMSKIVDYLRELMPIVQGANPAHLDPVLSKIANAQDFYLPFRQCAPTIRRAMSTILSSTERLKTRAGLFNILAFRGVFYGSAFARNDLRWFDDHQAWTTYYNSEKRKKKADAYYVNSRAYGHAMRGRSVDLLKEYWDASQGWEQDFRGLSGVKDLYAYLLALGDDRKKRFSGIGKLTALLICGDLVYAGLFPMPDVDTWAALVYRVGKGAVSQLQELQLVPVDPTPADVKLAFSRLHDYLDKTLTEDEKRRIGYDIIVLEHSLCKMKRYRRLREGGKK